MRDRRLACPLGKQPPQRGVDRCARRSARREGRRGARKARSRTPPKPPARLGWPRTGQRGPGVRYASPGSLAQRARLPGRRPRSERAHHHTGARERRAPKTRTGTRPGRGQARAKPAPQGVGLTQGTRRVLRLARAQPPPWRRSGKRAALAPTRAPPLWSERSERNRRGAQPRGWEGVGPQAVGCGLLLGSRGHPILFAVTAQQAPCGRCIGRPAGAKRKRASPCGLALFEVRTLSRAALVGAPILYHNLPLLSRPAFQFFGCRYTAGPPCCRSPRCAPALGRAGGGVAVLLLPPGCVPPNEKSP